MTFFKMSAPNAARVKPLAFKLGRLDRFLSLLLSMTALLFVAGFVHIVSIFALPEIAQKDAYSRMALLVQANPAPAEAGQVSLLPPPVPGHEYAPFEDPALVQGVCLYDLDRGPMEFSADIPSDELLTLSFRTHTGRVFYSMTDRAASHKKLDVIVLTAKQLEAVEADDDTDEPPEELRLTTPQKKGFVLINALVAFPSQRADIEALLKSMTCDTDEDQQQVP
jgi:uncharacterized membrane protein